MEAAELAPRQVEDAREAGALVIDVRTEEQFDEAHIPGSVSIPVSRAGFGSRLAWVAERDQPVIFVGDDTADGRIAGKLALAVGLRNLAGVLGGGITSWRREHSELVGTERISAEELARDPDGVQLLDVRERAEWEAGHINGAAFMPWHDITGLPEELDPDRPVAVMCASGQRAATAASLLQRHGARQVIHVVGGGVGTWERLGHTLVR